MDLRLEALTRASAADRDLHRPEMFRLPADRERLTTLLNATPGIRVHDELHSQLCEVTRALNPSIKYERPELDAAAKAHLRGTSSDEYGVWVWYPWSQRLVHLLDEREFAIVRTDRNRNKITQEEQALLGTKRIGVVGLSVGQSVSLALALERGFGELRLADFDTLDLSNLNRIRSGVQQLGLRKTVNVAREIAEIDPFLKVTLFSDGLNRENIDRFFSEGGKLDLLIEECDSVDIKILARQKARDLRVPVLMDTSDRGMLDIERFDLEPQRSILHGLIDHLDPRDAAKAKTNEEKLPFVVPILGLDTLSKRMKASMLEIETTTTTWPQLASSVVMGGGATGEMARRILLGQSTASGRWFMDIAEIVEGKSEEATERIRAQALPDELTQEQMERLADKLPALGADEAAISEDIAKSIVEAGAIAPSAGNNQPWKFMLAQGRMLLFHDVRRGFSELDGAGLIPRLSLGACLENMRIRASELGVNVDVSLFPLADDDRLVAELSCAPNSPPKEKDALAPFLTMRCTNRKKASGSSIDEQDLRELVKAANTVPGCEARTVSGSERMNAIADIVGDADRIRILNPIGHEELFGHEFRWTPQEAERTRDGLDLRTMELKLSEQAAMRVAADAQAIDMLRGWNAGRGFRKLSGDAIRRSSAMAIVSAPSSSKEHMIAGGRAVQRLWLRATELGIAVHPCSSPIFLSHHVRFGHGEGLTPEERAELSSLLDRFLPLIPMQGQEPLFMARLCHADPPSFRSLRRPIEEVYHYYQQPITA